jgi:4-hydroxy 2-oxovalerate aldolase
MKTCLSFFKRSKISHNQTEGNLHNCGLRSPCLSKHSHIICNAECASAIAPICLSRPSASRIIFPTFFISVNESNSEFSNHFFIPLLTLSSSLYLVGGDIFTKDANKAEASLTKTHIEYLISKGKTVYGVLMMSALCTIDILYEEAAKMKSYGALAIIIMDSTGSYMPKDVSERISSLTKLGIPIGFHAHNNLNLAVANSLVAIESGASIIDVTLRGFGAGAGNTPLEIMAFLHESKSINKNKILEQCDKFKIPIPICKPINILTSKYKLMSGFEKHILKASLLYNISYIKLIEEISKHNIIAGQEDFIYIIAKSVL